MIIINYYRHALVLVMGVSASLASDIPRFSSYPSGKVFSGKSPLLVFPSDHELMGLNTQRDTQLIREVASHGPNFGGHFVLVQGTCGSGCITVFFVDLRSGKVIPTSSFYSLIIGPLEVSGSWIQYRGLRFQRNSTLLIAEGCFDSTSGKKSGYCGINYYLIKPDGSLKTIRQTPFTKQ